MATITDIRLKKVSVLSLSSLGFMVASKNAIGKKGSCASSNL